MARLVGRRDVSNIDDGLQPPRPQPPVSTFPQRDRIPADAQPPGVAEQLRRRGRNPISRIVQQRDVPVAPHHALQVPQHPRRVFPQRGLPRPADIDAIQQAVQQDAMIHRALLEMRAVRQNLLAELP